MRCQALLHYLQLTHQSYQLRSSESVSLVCHLCRELSRCDVSALADDEDDDQVLGLVVQLNLLELDDDDLMMMTLVEHHQHVNGAAR